MKKTVKLNNITFGGNKPFVLIAGPCVIESKAAVKHIALKLKQITSELDIPFIFKASYDKANRTSVNSFRGPGIEKGLAILNEIKTSLNVPILSDVHSALDVQQAQDVLDIIQIPAFLCRQTDLLLAAGKSKKIVNVKKGQFLAPLDMLQVKDKVYSTGNKKLLFTERGTSFGYNNLVTDFRALDIMRKMNVPVVFDATHSVQQPGGRGATSGGCREYVPLLARCAIAAGCDAIFIEVHSNPNKAKSDGPNMVALKDVARLLKELKALDQLVKAKALHVA